MKKHLIFLFCFLVIPLVANAFAHQPRLVIEQINSQTSPIIIEEPEISKAYYGQIEKSSEYYKIDSSKGFDLYLSLQIPDIPMQSKNIILELKDESGLQLMYLDSSKHHWEKFHEDFGNADYLSGPSIQMALPSGIYTIKINGDENIKYVLVTGLKEEFPASEFLNSLFLVPKINQEFFGMNSFQSLANIFGFILLIIFSGIGFVILILVKRFLRITAQYKT